MCEQCCAETETYLSPIPGWWFVRATVDGMIMKAGDWGLVRCNDPDFVWDFIPWPEPEEGIDEQLESDWFEDWIRFDQALECRPEIGWELVNACIKAGYDPKNDGAVGAWLFNHLGEWLKTKKPFSHDRRNSFIVENLEAFGYIEPEQIKREAGKIYEIVSPNEVFVEYADATVEVGFDTPKWSGDLKFGTKVMLVENNGDKVKVLFDKNKYTIHRLFLSKEPVTEKE